MAQEAFGVEINRGPWGIDSRPALIGAKYAEAQGYGPAYHDQIFRTYWEHGQSIEEQDVLQSTAEAIGLDRDEFWSAVHDEAYETLVNNDIIQARMYGLSSVPSMVFDGKYLVAGAQPYDELRRVVEQIQARNGVTE
jgi:predicted DsbA family dithiol-disulfide isomerase